MTFLYTGASTSGQPQTNPDLSLGGWPSNSTVPNARLDNIFSDISYLGLSQLKTETKGLILWNEQATTATAISLGYLYPSTPKFKILVGIVTLNSSGMMEKIPDTYSLPYYATFQEANIPSAPLNPNVPLGGNSIVLPNIAAGGMLGIWFQRQLVAPASFPDDTTEMNYYKSVALNQVNFLQNIQLFLNFTQ